MRAWPSLESSQPFKVIGTHHPTKSVAAGICCSECFNLHPLATDLIDRLRTASLRLHSGVCQLVVLS